VKRNTVLEATIRTKYEAISLVLDERARRLWAAAESQAIGYGGDSTVSAATGLARATVCAGRKELKRGVVVTERVRDPGAGRPSIEKTQPGLKKALERLVSPITRGDPISLLQWTCKSKVNLATALGQQGFSVGATTVGHLLHELGYSLQSTRKSQEGTSHPDRNAQFEYINSRAVDFQQRNQPVISVDTKKKELVGDFKNAGQEWQQQGAPEKVQVHDFPDDAVGKAIPYGVYDMARDEAWVSVGIDHDTPAFAVASIRQWWRTMGQRSYPHATELLITADGGGSNGYRTRAWKVELQQFADDTGLRICVCHLPPGTSKWNKIEHRLFCHITQNWRGRPLASYATIVNLIGSTHTAKGLRVRASLDHKGYPTGGKITNIDIKQLALKRSSFHGEWNYELSPRGSGS
jgi:hypothetical protein